MLDNYSEHIMAYDNKGELSKTIIYRSTTGIMFDDNMIIDFGNYASFYMHDIFDSVRGVQKKAFGKLILDAGGRNHRGSEVYVTTRDLLRLPLVRAYLAYHEYQTKDDIEYDESEEDGEIVYIERSTHEKPDPYQWYMHHQTLINLGDISAIQLLESNIKLFVKSARFFELSCNEDEYNSLVSAWIEYADSKNRIIGSFPFIGISYDITTLGLITYQEKPGRLLINLKNGNYLTKTIDPEIYKEFLYLSRSVLIPSCEPKIIQKDS